MTKLYFISHVTDAQPELYEISVRNVATLVKLTELDQLDLEDGMPRSCCVTYDPKTQHIAPYFLYERDSAADSVERAIFERFAMEAEPRVRSDYERRNGMPRQSLEKIAADASEYAAIEADAEIEAKPESMRDWLRSRTPGPELEHEVGTVDAKPTTAGPGRRFAFRRSPETNRAVREPTETLAASADGKPPTR
jgi:hypothetical protein